MIISLLFKKVDLWEKVQVDHSQILKNKTVYFICCYLILCPAVGLFKTRLEEFMVWSKNICNFCSELIFLNVIGCMYKDIG
jgi:hypothetical protein